MLSNEKKAFYIEALDLGLKLLYTDISILSNDVCFNGEDIVETEKFTLIYMNLKKCGYIQQKALNFIDIPTKEFEKFRFLSLVLFKKDPEIFMEPSDTTKLPYNPNNPTKASYMLCLFDHGNLVWSADYDVLYPDSKFFSNVEDFIIQNRGFVVGNFATFANEKNNASGEFREEEDTIFEDYRSPGEFFEYNNAQFGIQTKVTTKSKENSGLWFRGSHSIKVINMSVDGVLMPTLPFAACIINFSGGFSFAGDLEERAKLKKQLMESVDASEAEIDEMLSIICADTDK